MKIIGILAGSHTQKEPLARSLLLCLGAEKVTTVAIADGIKEIICDCFLIEEHDVERWKQLRASPPSWSMTMRAAMHHIGESFRTIDPNIWLKRQLDGQLDSVETEYMIVTDLRYAEEVAMVQTREGIVVALTTPPVKDEEEVAHDRADRADRADRKELRASERLSASLSQRVARVRTLDHDAFSTLLEGLDIPINGDEESVHVDYIVKNSGDLAELSASAQSLVSTMSFPHV